MAVAALAVVRLGLLGGQSQAGGPGPGSASPVESVPVSVQNTAGAEAGKGFDALRGETSDEFTAMSLTNAAQSWTITPVNHGESSASTSLFRDFESVQRHEARSVGLEFRVGMFAANARLQQQARSSFTSSSQRFVAYTVSLIQLWRATAVRPVASTSMLSAAEALPEPSTSGAPHAAYIHFLRTYGTHFVKSVTLGGRARMESTVVASSAQQTGYADSQIESGLRAGFWLSAGVTAGISNSEEATWERISAFTESHLTVVGGDVRLAAHRPFNMGQWADSLTEENAVVVSRELGPVTELLPATLGARVDGLRTAITWYFQRCPVDNAQRVCGGRGACDPESGTCTCYDPIHFGTMCERTRCTAALCNGHGVCNTQNTCTCQSGWHDYDGNHCVLNCAVRWYTNPSYRGDHPVDEEAAFVSHPGAPSHSVSGCGWPGAQRFCAAMWGANGRTAGFGRTDSNVATACRSWACTGSERCSSVWPFRACRPFSSIGCADYRCVGILSFPSPIASTCLGH